MTVRTKENHSTKTKSDYNVLQFSFLNRPKELSPSYLEKNIFLKAEMLLVFEHVPVNFFPKSHQLSAIGMALRSR